jgi:hypothetical protein
MFRVTQNIIVFPGPSNDSDLPWTLTVAILMLDYFEEDQIYRSQKANAEIDDDST